MTNNINISVDIKSKPRSKRDYSNETRSSNSRSVYTSRSSFSWIRNKRSPRYLYEHRRVK